MATLSVSAGLLDLAKKTFVLANEFARWLAEINQPNYDCDPSGEQVKRVHEELRRRFGELVQAAIDCGPLIQCPPPGWEEVAGASRALAEWAAEWDTRVQTDRKGNAWLWLTSEGPDLATFAWNGHEAIKHLQDPSKRQKWDFLQVPSPSAPRGPVVPDLTVGNEADDAQPAKPPLALLDRFPATPAGHVSFLEFVRDEVHYAAEAKRQQFARGYSNETLANMVGGIKWEEANDRIALLANLPIEVVGQVARVFRRELTVGTVEQISELLAPAVHTLRDAYEESRLALELEGEFVGLLDAAVSEDESERQEGIRQFWIQKCGMPPTLTYQEGQVWARQEQQRRNTTDAVFRAKVRVWERLIEKRCRQRMLTAGFRDEELQGVYVPCLPAHVKSDDPRWHAYRAAFERLKLEERVMDGALVRDSANEEANHPQETPPELGLERASSSTLTTSSSEPAAGIGSAPAQIAAETQSKPKPKRSTQRGEGRAKLIAALTKHHQYADGGCLNLDCIGNNELARLADVAKRTASAFFEREFQGHAKYRVLCNDPPRLVAAMKALNGEFRPHEFYSARTPDEVEQEAE